MNVLQRSFCFINTLFPRKEATLKGYLKSLSGEALTSPSENKLKKGGIGEETACVFLLSISSVCNILIAGALRTAETIS